jgi:hypothetical protein
LNAGYSKGNTSMSGKVPLKKRPGKTKRLKRSRSFSDSENSETEKPKKKQRTAARMKEDPYWSDFSDSDDDDREMNAEERMNYLMERGRKKKAALTKMEVTADQDTFVLDQPHRRKIFAARRTNQDPRIDVDQLQSVRVGQQALNIQAGTGHFVTPGGNVRPEGIKEPPAEYKELFEQLMGLGNDSNAAPLCALLGIKKPEAGGKLTDYQVAALALYYMNNDVKEIEKSLKKRTQLTESLSKLVTIFGVAEQSRSFEAEANGELMPYDVSLFLKAGLTRVIKGDASLEQVFYQGKGGVDSIFLGAPSEKHSPLRIGGAAQLRNPLGHSTALARQMEIFDKKKGRFKRQLNTLKTTSKSSIAPLTAKKQKEQAKKVASAQVETANTLLHDIGQLEIPDDLNEFLNNKSRSPLAKYAREIKAYETKWAGNKDALAVLEAAKKALNQKRKTAQAKLGM